MRRRLRRWAIVAFVLIGVSLLAIYVGLLTRSFNRHLEPSQRTEKTGGNEQQAQNSKQNTANFSTVLELIVGGNLEKRAIYCAQKPSDQIDEWMKRYQCDIKLTDRISALGTIGSLALTFCLLIVGFLQFWIYLRQAGIMRLQAEIASKIVDLEQPYLLVANVGNIWFKDTTAFMQRELYHDVFAEIQIMNYGRTPALLSMVQATILFAEFELFETDFRLCSTEFPDEIVGTERSDVVAIKIHGVKFNHGMMEDIQNGKRRPFAYGRIRYSNGVGGVMEAGFAFKAESINFKFVRSPYSRHNYRRTYQGEEAEMIHIQPKT